MALTRAIILASGSAIRRQLLASAGVPFAVHPANVDEGELRAQMLNESDCVVGAQIAGALARAKALAVSRLMPDALVIGADQVLALGTRLFDKPTDLVAARDHLDRLRGQTHELVSAVVLVVNGQPVWGMAQAAQLTMRPFSDAFLDGYVATAGDRICSCVGAYELEGLGLQLFERIEGDYFTILGLPLLPLLTELRARGALPT